MPDEDLSKLTPDELMMRMMRRRLPMAPDDSSCTPPEDDSGSARTLTLIAVVLLSGIGLYRIVQSGERDLVVVAMATLAFPLISALMGAAVFIWRRAWWRRIPIVMLAVAGLFVLGPVAEWWTSLQEALYQGPSVQSAAVDVKTSVPVPERWRIETNVDRTGTYAAVRLPYMQFQLPVNWTVLSQDERTTTRAATVGRMARDGVVDMMGKYSFAANLYYETYPIALMNVKHYPDIDMTQEELRALSATELDALSDVLRRDIGRTFLTVFSWRFERIEINGTAALVYGYERTGVSNRDDRFVVRMVRVLDGPRSFTLTISYARSREFLLEPLTDYVIRSIQRLPV